MNNDKIFELFINALVLFTALPVHECAHAWVAHKMGDDTAKNQGRIIGERLVSVYVPFLSRCPDSGFGWEI